jgi:hypothetical protein
VTGWRQVKKRKEILMGQDDYELEDGSYRGCGITIGRMGSGYGYEIISFGRGFESTRMISSHDLRDIRDWINRELEEDG